MVQSMDATLKALAEEAGLLLSWRDAHGAQQHVAADTVRALLMALELPCSSESQCRESLKMLRDESQAASPPIVVARAGSPLVLKRAGSPHYRLQLEDGKFIMGTARAIDGDQVAISGLTRPGYHLLEMGRVRTVIAVTPSAAPSVRMLAGRERAWLLAAQVYGLCRERGTADSGAELIPGWEVGGDYSSVGLLARQAARYGAAGLAMSPVHALFSADPQRHSPYSPSSRLFLNAMHADPVAVLGEAFVHSAGIPESECAATCQGLLDWAGVYERRLAAFRRLYEQLLARQPEALSRDFQAFREEGGQALRDHARYEALHAHYAPMLGAAHGWQDWPADLHDPGGTAVERFAHDHESEVRFHAFLQWLAARNLAQAHQGAREAGMALGLVADMAVGTDPRGSQAWCRQGQLMSGISVGAPPDIFQPQGQDWGLTAFSPRASHLNGHAGHIEIMRAALAHAGGLRVDHVLGLARMWLVPSAASPADGAYLRYPRDELLSLLALEAWRHRAVVVGENLGTVPEDFNDAMTEHGILGMNVLWFEQDRAPDQAPRFRSRNEWPRQTMAMATTHDLPTVTGWWQGRDIEWRERLGEVDGQTALAQKAERLQQKAGLWQALHDVELVQGDLPSQAPTEAVLTYLAGTPSALLSIGLEDLLGSPEQPNLPGAARAADGETHPNWRRTYPGPVQNLLESESVGALLQRVGRARQGGAAERAS